MKKVFFYALALISIFACSTETEKAWEAIDLLAYGLPVSIHAPDSALVKVNSSGVIKDITIEKGNTFEVQVFASPITSNSLTELKTAQVEEVKSNRYFTKILKDEEQGFVYETAIDSNNVNYGFRWVHYQGDLEYVFQQSLGGIFSKDAVEKMYEAVKQ